MQAVILAAGLGSRIREQHKLPKGFICLDGVPIIQHSINKLIHFGINKILIVTGYACEEYENFVRNLHGVETVFNPRFAQTSSLESLICAQNWLSDDFLLLESDIIYEARAIEALLTAPHNSHILLSGTTNSGDEVYVEARNKQLVNMSKSLENLQRENVLGEFVGINKLMLADYKKLVDLVYADPLLLQNGHYEEQGLVTLAKHTPLNCLKIDDLVWAEIDNQQQLLRAQTLYPQMST